MVCRGTNVVRSDTAGWGTALQAEFAGSNPDYAIGIFHWHILPDASGPGVDSTTDRNEYQEYFLGG